MNSPTQEERLSRVEDAVIQHAESASGMRQSLAKMADALITLAQLEVRHSETRSGLEKLERVTEDNAKRISSIEIQIPPLVEIRVYLLRGVVAILSAVGLALVAMVVHKGGAL